MLRKSWLWAPLIAVFLSFCATLMVLAGGFALAEGPGVAEDAYSSLAAQAARFNFQAYLEGKPLDAYDAYVLTDAGADVAGWVYGDRSLKDSVLNATYRSLENPLGASAKEIAQQLLAVTRWGYGQLADQLAELLKQRQKTDGSFDGSIYSDIPSYEFLALAGKLSVVNATYARNYLLGTQCTVVGETYYGAWVGPLGPDFMSTAQAIRALKSLPGADQDQEIQSAIQRGLDWMKKQQSVDGSVYYIGLWPDDPLIDTAETVFTLKTLGIDPSSWQSSAGKTPVDYLVYGAPNGDGSFGAYKNVLDATWALRAYWLLGGSIPSDTPLGLTVKPSAATINANSTQQFQAVLHHFSSPASDVTAGATWSVDGTIASVEGPGLVKGLEPGETVVSATYGAFTARATLTVTSAGGSGPGETDQITVGVAVVGKNNELLHPPGYVVVRKDNRWGYTALGALDATGLSYDYRKYSFGVLVTCIQGQCNQGTEGWMYKVNDRLPDTSADQKPVRNGDKVVWWYSKDINSSGPTWDELQQRSSSATSKEEPSQGLPAVSRPSPEAEEALGKLAQLLGLPSGTVDLGPVENVKRAVVVVGEKAPPLAERLALKKELDAYPVDLAQKVVPGKDTVLADAKGEVALNVPAGALNREVELTLKETGRAGEVPAAPAGYRRISSLYECGPEGTTFTVPVTLTLRVPLPVLAKPEDVVLARYDGPGKGWTALPAVVDAGKGLVVAKIRHLSTFAVLVRETRVSFTDVTGETLPWARDAVELLGGAGILKGVDENRFEPAREVTRAEATAMLVRTLGLPAATTRAAFRDVRENDWYAGELAAAVSAGLVRGYEDGSFRPDRPITREELVTVLARALNLSSGEGANLPFADAGTVAAWARDSVAAAVSAGLVRGYPDGTFRPGNPITRAECAVVVYRALAE